jgi:hypothetical protein
MQGIQSSQTNVKRLSLKCPRQFDEMYDRQNQYNAVVNLTGSTDEADKFINRNTSSDLYLIKGQLIAYKDFIYKSQQEMTSLCLNSAPIWQVIRKGNWRHMGNSIRQYAGRNGKDLTVYTGTYGTLHVSHVNGTRVPFYLGTDRNGRSALPVPKFFWKIVYDRLMRRGIVFILINSYRDDTRVAEYEICSDVCDRTQSWFHGWDRFRVTLGYVYCCTVRDFLAKTGAVPEFREVVTDLLT